MTDNFSELKGKFPQIITAHSAYKDPNKTEKKEKNPNSRHQRGNCRDFKVPEKWLNACR